MRKRLCVLILLAGAGMLHAQMFSAGIGTSFFQYERTFLDLEGAYHQKVADTMEMVVGAHVAIATEERGGQVAADFLIAGELGLEFLFPTSPVFVPYFGAGLSPQFSLAEETSFFLGPYGEAGFRLNVHPYMDWFLELQQELTIGPPRWINNSTRLSTGILFHF
ncbi:hypothetical protein Spith_2014 [Spirochaeta thermophila DSM 6578]|uniref:Outer membrane protein beta-barrel domain-containing protein n=1 Tax=Winmispira thermophila (strain ATCC 700085 / DSM 6578 / Z-1203) TaxID=869211 RepID=G0GED5_WINT7|nr:hypothetical protein [Spirochaeta thermophila]AEJ62272.1 hypothetical protein Spith_2014 [Spirochaeta thermophila DSM 6578]